jgi:hypothetical protein
VGPFLGSLVYETGEQTLTLDSSRYGYFGYHLIASNYDFLIRSIGGASLEYGKFESTIFSSHKSVIGANLVNFQSADLNVFAEIPLVAVGDTNHIETTGEETRVTRQGNT